MVAFGVACPSLGRDASKVQPVDYVAELKRFTEQPPIIKSLKGSVQGIGAGDGFFEFRYQPGAQLIKKSSKLELLQRPDAMVGDKLCGCFDQAYWNLESGGMLCCFFTPEVFRRWQATNESDVIFWSRFFPANYIMNMGLPRAHIGGLRWDGNHTTGTRWEGGQFAAELLVGTDGRPSGVRIRLEPLLSGPYSHKTPFVYVIAYEYDPAIPGWPLPTTIKGESATVEVLGVQLADRPQSKWRFHYAPYLNHRSFITAVEYVTNTPALWPDHAPGFDEQKQGLSKMLWFWVPKSQVKRLYFIAVCLLTASIVTVAAVQMSRKRKNQEI